MILEQQNSFFPRILKGLGWFSLGIIILLLLLSRCSNSLLSQNQDVYPSAPLVVMKLEGPIMSSEDILKELDHHLKNDEVKAIVFRVDSPGGAVAPSQEIYSQILKLRAKGKKVIISMGTLAASGGYYIASAGDKIVASSGTITGSIGVIMQSFGLQEIAKWARVEPRIIKSGKMKDAGNPFRKMTESEEKYLQDLSNNLYEQFVRDIAKQRGLKLERAHELAEGRVYSGEQALALGLVDEIGNLFDAITLAKKEAKLASDAEVAWPQEPSPFEQWMNPKALLQSVLRANLAGTHLPTWSSNLGE